MIVPFDTLAGTSRVWVYQSSKELTDADQALIKNEMKVFLEGWTAHQATLKAGFEIVYNRFVVIAVDENHNDASGCSIDKKVNFIKSLGDKIHTDFFNRLQVAYLEGNNIRVISMHDVIEKLSHGVISKDTLMFNNLVETLDQLRNEWQIPVGKSWLQQLAIR